jgi:hypothetical protein
MYDMGGGMLKVPIRVEYIPTPIFSHVLVELSTNKKLGSNEVARLGLKKCNWPTVTIFP